MLKSAHAVSNPARVEATARRLKSDIAVSPRRESIIRYGCAPCGLDVETEAELFAHYMTVHGRH